MRYFDDIEPDEQAYWLAVLTERDDLRARVAVLTQSIETALRRYDNPDESHNKRGGYPRGEIAWAMADDLRAVLAASTSRDA